ncbi:GNAT family N-acetyltransferase [Listeria ivanovii]|uniref:GNAT family N-acetyltransferase n=1 Tax=Listeria ivanovii TaxID=1638 RepID=UPI00162596EA|nr:GNAT family N-acetyltransferase [Listeria ivanovii]MBC2254481.1 GNAT family N-acetyltransferase [Listeria ivanovii]
MAFQIKELPLEEVESKVVEGLLDHKRRLGFDIPKSDATYVSFAILNDALEMVGGVTAKMSYGELYVSLLSVDESQQGSGLGTALMNEIEAYGKTHHCHHISLTTFSYQAPEFYKKCGYTELGRIQDFPLKGEEKYFFVKYL